MERNPVNWFEIYVGDIQRAKAFYEKVLGVTLDRLADPGPGVAEMMTFPMIRDGQGASGALVHMTDGPRGNGTIVYFSCADCAEECARAPAAGGKIMKEKFAIGQYGFIAIVTDPDGNAIGLHSLK